MALIYSDALNGENGIFDKDKKIGIVAKMCSGRASFFLV